MFKKIALLIFLAMTALAVVVALQNDREVTTSSQEAYEHYKSGLDLVEKFYVRDAISELEQAVALDSNFAIAQGELAMAYFRRGFVNKGKEMQEKAIANREHVSEREQLIIDVWQQQWNANSDSAYTIAEQLVEAYPNDINALSTMAGMEFGRNNWEQSLQYYQKALEIQSDYAPAYNMLGYLNFYLGRYDDALYMLDQYLEYAKDQANPHDSRGEILHATGRYEEAIAAFRQAYNINPEFDYAITHMAGAYTELGKMSEADYCFKIVLDAAPNDRKRLSYLAELARVMIYREDLDSATTLCKYIMNEDSHIEDGGATVAPFLLGLIYYDQRDAEKMKAAWDTAQVIMEKALAKTPEGADSPFHERFRLVVKATEADLAGDLPEAEELFFEALETVSRPNDKFYYRMMVADILKRNDKHDLAISELQKNLSINPNHAFTLIALADIYDDQGDRASARAYREKALEVWGDADPGFKPAQELRKKLERTVAAMKSEKGAGSSN